MLLVKVADLNLENHLMLEVLHVASLGEKLCYEEFKDEALD